MCLCGQSVCVHVFMWSVSVCVCVFMRSVVCVVTWSVSVYFCGQSACVCVCYATGSLWQPNISLAQLTGADGRPVLTVSFQPDALCEEYMVIVGCARNHHKEHVFKVSFWTGTQSASW